MLTVGDKLPALTVPVQQGTPRCPAGETLDLGETNGKWKVLFYWPKDFTFVCPTEIVGYGELKQDFADRDADPDRRFDRHRPCPLRLAQVGRAAGRCGFPVDRGQQEGAGRRARHLRPEEGVAYRATFIIDPDNVIQHVTVNGLNVGRNPAGTLRVLDALQTDELCPCNWTRGRRGTEASGLSGPCRSLLLTRRRQQRRRGRSA